MPLGWVAAGTAFLGAVNSNQQSKRADYQNRQANQRMSAGDTYIQQMNDLMSDPSSIEKDPGYQFTVEQGSKAVARSGAAAGYLGSGNMATALSDYGQGTARSYLHDKLGTLYNMAGYMSGSAQPYFAQAAQSQAASDASMDKAIGSLATAGGYAMGKSGGSGGSSSNTPVFSGSSNGMSTNTGFGSFGSTGINTTANNMMFHW